MTNPLKRLFGGMVIGFLLAIAFIQFQGSGLAFWGGENLRLMPLFSSDSLLAWSVAFLALTCGWVGANATRKARCVLAIPSTVESFRQRRMPNRRQHWLG